MLKAAGVFLVIFACSLMGFQKSMLLTARLRGLKELQRMVLFIKGEISYRKSALPEALLRTAGKMQPPFSDFLMGTAKRADAFEGNVFSDIFAQEADKAFGNYYFTQEDKERLKQLGQYLGYMDIKVQESTIALYLEELELKIQEIQAEIPAKKKLYQSMGVLGGVFLAIVLL